MASDFHFQFYIRGHARKYAAHGIIDADFYANDLVDALFAGLHIARQEFGLLIDLLYDAVERGVRKRIDANFGLLAKFDAADLRFRNVDTNVNLILVQARGDGRVGSD